MSFIKICPRLQCFITAPLWFEFHCFIIHIVTNEPNGPGSLIPSKLLRYLADFHSSTVNILSLMPPNGISTRLTWEESLADLVVNV